jgi:diadenosine tetraphosphate (Ap4A) HIT family hydrolase
VSCPFCAPPVERVFHQDDLVLGLWDAFPVAAGHALIVPRRHVAGWFEIDEAERIALIRGTDAARTAILAHFPADGFTIGVNDGVAAGQTVSHLHLHVIPRVRGDVADPRGGVRWVIPDKAAYWPAGR